MSLYSLNNPCALATLYFHTGNASCKLAVAGFRTGKVSCKLAAAGFRTGKVSGKPAASISEPKKFPATLQQSFFIEGIYHASLRHRFPLWDVVLKNCFTVFSHRNLSMLFNFIFSNMFKIKF